MGEEKIFKDLTKKYAELANKIHSKDKRSVSLIKDCSKRIALLDKLRVLEVSYLKCLKNKVKKGGVGGELTEEEAEKQRIAVSTANNKEEEKNNENQDGLSNQQVSIDDNDDANKKEAHRKKDNHQLALDMCTATVENGFNALDNSIILTGKAGKFIKENAVYIYENSKGMDANDVKTSIEDAIQELGKNGMNAEEAKKYLYDKSNTLAKNITGRLEEFYDKKKDTTLEDVVKGIIETKNKFSNTVSPTIGRAKEGINKARNGINSFLGYGNTNPPQQQPSALNTSNGGGKKTTYRLNGEKVVLLHKNKKVQRSIYVKDKGKTKYCKIDHQYILLSKLKNKIQ